MATNKREPKLAAQLSILRLALMAHEVRRELPAQEIERVPSLKRAFSALDAVIKEMGWSDGELKKHYAECD
jgi:hypothetical protein